MIAVRSMGMVEISDERQQASLLRLWQSMKSVEAACRVCVGIFGESDCPVQELTEGDVSGNGRVVRTGRGSTFQFSSDGDTFQVRLRLRRVFLGNGVAFRLRPKGWRSIRYLAIGYTVDRRFRHIKVRNPAPDEWAEVGFSHDDTLFGIQNNWELPEVARIGDLRIYIRGEPSCTPTVEVDECLIYRCKQDDFPMWRAGDELESFQACVTKGALSEGMSQPHERVLRILEEYLSSCFPSFERQVETFMRKGVVPLRGEIELQWAVGEKFPSDLRSINTFRFSWHALYPVAILMLMYRRTGGMRYLFPARQLVDDWLTYSFFAHGADDKFEWYDHGTAERAIVLILVWASGIQHNFDHRFMCRLLLAIHKHAVLLSSEAFYALHQGTRYHNHAWFQDVALMATGMAMSGFPASRHWITTACSRLKAQFNRLVVRDSGFSVFIENSVDYHRGIERLALLASDLSREVGIGGEFPAIAAELPEFSKLLQYPDGRYPAHGDTIRLTNTGASERKLLPPYAKPSSHFLPKAGYAVVKGNDGDAPYMFAMIASALCRTHKHEDNLSFTLFFDGVEWLIDPSFFSHEYAYPVSAYLRSAAAHNALYLPSCDYSIDPGKAQINGTSEGEEFTIVGEHTAYEGAVVTREVRGRTDRLALRFVDRATGKEAVGATRMMLHFGDGVEAALRDRDLSLVHPSSQREVEITLPTNEASLFFGHSAEPIRGVSGLGFMRMVNVYTLECVVEANVNLHWAIRARKG